MTDRRKLKRASGAALLLLLVTAAAAFWYFRQRSYEEVRPKRGDITEAVYGLGKVISNRRFEVKIGLLTTVTGIFVREGDAVERGRELMTLESGAVFRAPFAGTVTLVSVKTGETALPQTPLLRLEDLRDLYIEISLEQEGALRVRRGQPAKISFESLRGHVLSGKVTALFARDDEFLVHIQAEALPEGVLPGMTADVSIEIGKIANALLIPLRAVHNGQVIVQTGGQRKKRRIEIGHVDGLWAEVKNDALDMDDTLLLKKTRKGD